MASVCRYFNNGKWVNLPENANYLEYLNDMINCLNNSGYYDYYDPRTKAFRNRVDDAIRYERNTPNIDNFEPAILRYVNGLGSINIYDSMYSDGVSPCVLCKKLNILGFDNTIVAKNIRDAFKNINPNTKKLFLLYKDLIIYDNSMPYMKGHLMISTLNHVDSKIVGSQYEILNIVFLTKILEFYKLCSNGITMGHNYAQTGSQVHFHLHLFLDEYNKNIPYNEMLNDFVVGLNTVPVDIKTTNDIDIPDSLGTQYKLNYTINNEDNLKIIISKFNSTEYGYSGILVTIEKNDNQNLFKKYCATIHKILNEIENSGTHSFSLYFAKSDNHLILCILPQSLNTKPRRTKNVESFRNITAFVTLNNRSAYDYTDLRDTIKTYIDLNVFTIEELGEFVNNRIYNQPNPMGDPQLNMLLDFDRTNKTYNQYFLSLIKDKTRVENPKVVLYHGPAGIGKSSSKSDLDKILSDLNLDQNNFIYFSIDNVFESIPYVKKKLDKVTNVMKKFLDMKLSEISSFVNHDFTLKELKDDEKMNRLSLDDYTELYNGILNTKFDFTNYQTIYQYYNNDIKNTVQHYRNKIQNSFFEFVKNEKLNIICEVITLNFSEKDVIQNYTNELGLTRNNTIYISKHFHLVDDNIDNITLTQKKFLYRNILLRNIDSGRLFNINDITQTLERFYRGHNLININNEKRTTKNNIAYKYFSIYTNYDLSNDTVQYFNNFSSNIHNYKFSYEHSRPGFFENSLKDLKCLVKDSKEIDEDLFIDVKEPLTRLNYKFACFNLPPLLGLDEKFDMYSNIKNKLTDYNTEFLFNDNVSSIIMSIFIKSMEESIKKYISKFKDIKVGRLKDQSINLRPGDIKVILKGGLSIRALSNQYIIHIKDTIGNNINLEAESNLQFKNLNDIFKSTMDNKIKSPFEGIFKKSDIDYLCYLKKDKITYEDDYNIIIRDLQKITIVILEHIKTIIEKTNFFDRETILIDNLNNIFNENITEPETDVPLTHIIYKSKSLSSPTAVKIKLKSSFKKSSYIDKMGSITNNPDDSRSLYIVPEFMLIESRLSMGSIQNKYSSYFITVNNNIKIIKGMVETFSLVRMKNCYSCGFNNDPDLSKTFSGELIDVAFLSYNSSEHEVIKENPHFLDRVRQTKDLFDYEVNVFSLQFQMHEIEKMLIDTSIYIWENPKYKKRILRYYFIDLIEKFSSIDNISDYPQIHHEYYCMLQYIKGEMFARVSDTDNQIVEILNTEEELICTSSNKFLLYLLNIKSDVNKFVQNKINIDNFVDNAKNDFNINLTLNTPQKIEDFKKYLQTNLDKFIIDLQEILLNVVLISQNLFNLYSIYPNKLTELKNLRTQETNIKQWGGYKNLYKDIKNKYYKLKYKTN